MTTTGQQIRERMVNRDLVFIGKSTALAGGTDRLRDAGYFAASTLSTSDEEDGWIRITSVSNSDEGFVAKIKRIDVSTGDIYFSPAAGAAIVSGTTYEIWRHGARPDRVDRARDIALSERCSNWLVKPLSLLPDVAEWRTAAYSARLGGVVNATGAQTAMAFPTDFYPFSMLVTNSGAVGYIASPSLDVRPSQWFRLWARVSTRAQTATVRARDVTNGADITLNVVGGSESSFAGRGWQWCELRFEIPASCYELQLWAGGASASCIAEFAGLGLLSERGAQIGLQARVKSEHSVGNVYVYALNIGTPEGELERTPISGIDRARAGAGVVLTFPYAPGSEGPVFYQERHRYVALQTDYLAKSDRITGDAATTDCPLEYAEAATTVVLLEGMVATKPELKPVLLTALKDLGALERDLGPDPEIFEEPRNLGGGVRLMQL